MTQRISVDNVVMNKQEHVNKLDRHRSIDEALGIGTARCFVPSEHKSWANTLASCECHGLYMFERLSYQQILFFGFGDARIKISLESRIKVCLKFLQMSWDIHAIEKE